MGVFVENAVIKTKRGRTLIRHKAVENTAIVLAKSYDIFAISATHTKFLPVPF
jgi:hypothetical protein